MTAPEAHLRIGACTLTLLGTVPGSVPDGHRVRDAVARDDPDAIAVGVPPEDLEALHALQQDPDRLEELPELDEMDAHFVGLLGRFVEVQVAPSPDLAAAYEAKRLLHPVDLDDASHTDRYTQRMKVRHLVQRSSVHRRTLKRTFEEATDPWDLARQWDRALARVKPLAAIEVEREAVMATGLRTLADRYGRLVAVVPAARFDGVLSRLTAASPQS